MIPFGAALSESLNARPKPQSYPAVSRILIVDLVHQQGGIVHQLGLQANVGFADVLGGNASWDAAILRTGHSQVDLLPYGEGKSGPASSSNLAALWKQMHKAYPVILLSGGAWSQSGDEGISPATLLSVADAVALRVELSATPQAVAAATRHAVAARGGNLIGCIVRGSPFALN
jgi:hypothetical protein